jgi:fatty-acyl-CoA synthase
MWNHAMHVAAYYAVPAIEAVLHPLNPRSEYADAEYERRLDIRASNGLPLPTVDVRIVDEQGSELPWDGQQRGELQARGPWIARGYIGHPSPQDQQGGTAATVCRRCRGSDLR